MLDAEYWENEEVRESGQRAAALRLAAQRTVPAHRWEAVLVSLPGDQFYTGLSQWNLLLSNEHWLTSGAMLQCEPSCRPVTGGVSYLVGKIYQICEIRFSLFIVLGSVTLHWPGSPPARRS